MSSIELKETSHSPRVICRPNGEITLYGRSIPENAIDFYMPILKWLEGYKNSPASETNYTFELDYINSISFKMIYEVLKVGRQLKESGHTVNVEWKYEEDDEEILDQGKTFEQKSGLNFKFTSI
jgi:hypothetical protein